MSLRQYKILIHESEETKLNMCKEELAPHYEGYSIVDIVNNIEELKGTIFYGAYSDGDILEEYNYFYYIIILKKESSYFFSCINFERNLVGYPRENPY
jgi:hypothetical protein